MRDTGDPEPVGGHAESPAGVIGVRRPTWLARLGRALSTTVAALVLSSAWADAARPDSGDQRVRLVLDGFDAPAGLALTASTERGDRALVDSNATICPSDLGSFSDASVLGIRGGGLPGLVTTTWDSPGVWRERLAHRTHRLRHPPDARLTRSIDGDSPRWSIEWLGGPRLVALKVNPGVRGMHVRDLEYHRDYAASSSGAAFVIVAPDRVRPVVVVADGVAPMRFSADELRAALNPGAARVLERAPQPGVRLRVKFEVQERNAADLLDVSGFAWDAATGALVRRGVPGAGAGAMEFRDLGSEAVTVVIQARQASGHAWLGTWNGLPGGGTIAAVTLVRSAACYRLCSGPNIDVARSGAPESGGRPFTLLQGEQTIESELGPSGWFVQPGEYEVRPRGASATGSVHCIVRDGVCFEIVDGPLVR